MSGEKVKQSWVTPSLDRLHVNRTMGGFVTGEPESETFTNPETGATATGANPDPEPGISQTEFIVTRLSLLSKALS